jgi:hypothetical protein
VRKCFIVVLFIMTLHCRVFGNNISGETSASLFTSTLIVKTVFAPEKLVLNYQLYPFEIMKNTIWSQRHRHHCQYNPFRAIAFLINSARLVSIRLSEFHFFGFCNNIFTEQICQPCVKSPVWRTRSLYLFCPSDRVAQLHLQAPGSLFVVFYDSQGYGGGISNTPPQSII